jgi:hypothetical protein
METFGKLVVIAGLIAAAWYGAEHGWGFWSYLCAFMAGGFLMISDEQARRTRQEMEEACRRQDEEINRLTRPRKEGP